MFRARQALPPRTVSMSTQALSVLLRKMKDSDGLPYPTESFYRQIRDAMAAHEMTDTKPIIFTIVFDTWVVLIDNALDGINIPKILSVEEYALFRSTYNEYFEHSTYN